MPVGNNNFLLFFAFFDSVFIKKPFERGSDFFFCHNAAILLLENRNQIGFAQPVLFLQAVKVCI